MFSKSNKTKLIQVAISKENHEKLKNLGRAGDSFNDVISELLKKGENK